MNSFIDKVHLTLLLMPKSLFAALLVLLCTAMAATLSSQAQDSLPRFSLQERNGMVIIGWINPFEDITELVVQRSLDSVQGFKSIVSMPDPKAISNGFLDRKTDASRHYYRIFYIREGLRYTFSPARRTIKNEGEAGHENSSQQRLTQANDAAGQGPLTSPGPSSTTENANTQFDAQGNLMASSPKNNRNTTTPGTQSKIASQLPEEIFTPSALIFTDREGNLIIALPEAGKRKYTLKVFREDGTPLFTMKQISETQLLVDRSNFFHSGWFRFMLFDGEKPREEGRFFIPPAIR
jgi:hypothetical protein